MIRKGLWGEYSRVHVELALPDIPVLPLFSDIPYSITVTTSTPPLSRAHASEHSSKPVFPPVPRKAQEIDFVLHCFLKLRARLSTGKANNDVMTILGDKKEETNQVAVESDIPDKKWVPLASVPADDKHEKEKEASEHGEEKGSWVQRATYQSTFRLNCPPSSVVANIECSYSLIVKVPFPGSGNSLKLEVPATITSGIADPLPQEQSNSNDDLDLLDLPPSVSVSS
ncbi:hypothetical protein BD309DRAFT_40846 [Dichomitus squalens]|nr:hypothetical protein BD309DRAFT_40846 [Dichomitus squalens]